MRRPSRRIPRTGEGDGSAVPLESLRIRRRRKDGAVRFLILIIRNLRRNRLRALLTVLGTLELVCLINI